MRRHTLVVVAILLALAVVLWPKTATQQVVLPVPPYAGPARTAAPPPASPSTVTLPAFLPREARTMVATIQRGGPFRHRQDGSVFDNREGLLPKKQRGYYREYTVDTPGVEHRGARRIVTGGTPPRAWYYTDDHYDSFRAFDVYELERRQ
ncbi:MAG: ribonuclease domain-containing protein [Luteimonas sp.]